MAEYPPLTLFAYGSTSQDVEDLLEDRLFLLWDQYVCDESRALSGDAQELRANLLDHIEEIAIAEA